jgi:ABC-type lipoprotein export system ATPase subunit
MSQKPAQKHAAPQATKPTQQRLLELEVVQLKGLKDVKLDFRDKALTAIMGSNCSGKTTVLHALACAYRPLESGDPDYHFPRFFRPNSDALWKDSNFTIRHSQRLGSEEFPNLSQAYTKATDRWSPRYDRRPQRYTKLVGIGECVPDIETLTLQSMIYYQKDVNNDVTATNVRDVAGQVLNRDYQTLYTVTYKCSKKPSYGVTTQEITYSGLSMSSGEQRVFRILEAVFHAPKYALILVDEIDLFLHQDALRRLLDKLNEHCKDKHKQLIFTTHFPPVAQMYGEINIYTLNRASAKTTIWRGYSYEAMRHITGKQEHPINCYVEDDVADQMVGRVAVEVGIRRFLGIGRYGPAGNAFNLGAGLCLSLPSVEDTLIILDGDVYGTRPERQKCVDSAISGNQEVHEHQRQTLMHIVRPFAPMGNSAGALLSPEQVLHRMLHSLDPETVSQDRRELLEIAAGVINVPEKHGFVDQIIEHTGESREVALSKIVELASRSTLWPRYTRVVRTWFKARKAALGL